MKNHEVRLTLRIPPDLRTGVAMLAEQEHRSFNAQVLHMLKTALKQTEQGSDKPTTKP